MTNAFGVQKNDFPQLHSTCFKNPNGVTQHSLTSLHPNLMEQHAGLNANEREEEEDVDDDRGFRRQSAEVEKCA